MIKTFIFDLGNVIVRFEHSRITWRIEQFCEFKADKIYEIILASNLTQDYNLGKISSPDFFAQVKKKLSLQMSFTEFSNIWNSTFDLEPILSKELIESLAKKYSLLVLSDTNELHFEFIRQNFPILRFFDDYVLSYQVGAIKPASEIFLSALEKANCLPEECFFIDDIEPNILGAQKVGINAMQFVSENQFIEDLKKLKLIS